MIICDTGPLVAVLNKRDDRHGDCVELLESHSGPLLVPCPVLAEVCYFLETRVGPAVEAQFLDSIEQKELELVNIVDADITRMAQLVRQYADFPLGTVDASVIAVAERLGATQIATLDRRHFLAVRNKTSALLRLLPE